MFQHLHNLWKRIKRPKQGLVAFPGIFERFQELLQNHQQVMELIADLGEKSGGEYIFDRKYLSDTVDEMHTLFHVDVDTVDAEVKDIAIGKGDLPRQ